MTKRVKHRTLLGGGEDGYSQIFHDVKLYGGRYFRREGGEVYGGSYLGDKILQGRVGDSHSVVCTGSSTQLIQNNQGMRGRLLNNLRRFLLWKEMRLFGLQNVLRLRSVMSKRTTSKTQCFTGFRRTQRFPSV